MISLLFLSFSLTLSVSHTFYFPYILYLISEFYFSDHHFFMRFLFCILLAFRLFLLNIINFFLQLFRKWFVVLLYKLYTDPFSTEPVLFAPYCVFVYVCVNQKKISVKIFVVFFFVNFHLFYNLMHHDWSWNFSLLVTFFFF